MTHVHFLSADKEEVMKWFTVLNEKVEGPYTTEVLKRKIETGDLSSDSLVWGPLQLGWKPLSWWQQALPHLKSIHTEIVSPEEWYMVKDGRRSGPMTREQLITQLGQMADNQELIARVLVWAKGFKQWTPVAELHELMNDLGLDQRKHPRARAHGRVTISFQGQTYSSSLKSISEAGLGAEPIPMVYAGEEVQISIESEELGSEISAKAEVRYANSSNLGLRFLALNSENKASIVSYIKSRATIGHKMAA